MSNFNGLIVLVGAVTCLVAAVASFVFVGGWILEPVNKAGGSLQAPTRFLLTDFIWLMLQLQIVLGLASQYLLEALPRPAFFLFLGLVSVPLVVLWAASVSVVSRAGIVRPLRRATVILILVPGALAAMMAVPFLIVGMLVFGAQLWQRLFFDDRGLLLQQAALLAGGAIALVAAAIALRWLSFWVLSEPASRSSVPGTIP